MRAILAVLAALVLLGAAPPEQLDSQVVLAHYASALARVEQPKNVVFTYSVSQAGPHDIEQQHRIYRSGENVRDETLSMDGQSLRRKVTRISRYRDRYAVYRLAPRADEYTFLFMSAARSGKHYTYTYQAVPLIKSSSFVVESITIDGASYLPTSLQFRTSNGTFAGTGSIAYASAGPYWVPVLAQVSATIAGKPARERIAFSGYSFPPSLPSSTFQTARTVPKTVRLIF
ncbi:MAG: hypothetical protein ACXWNK_05185 [Vulcanimicrobiaceae bacterium]